MNHSTSAYAVTHLNRNKTNKLRPRESFRFFHVTCNMGVVHNQEYAEKFVNETSSWLHYQGPHEVYTPVLWDETVFKEQSLSRIHYNVHQCIFISYNTLRRYVYCGHSLTNCVITVIFYASSR